MVERVFETLELEELQEKWLWPRGLTECLNSHLFSLLKVEAAACLGCEASLLACVQCRIVPLV